MWALVVVALLLMFFMEKIDTSKRKRHTGEESDAS